MKRQQPKIRNWQAVAAHTPAIQREPWAALPARRTGETAKPAVWRSKRLTSAN